MSNTRRPHSVGHEPSIPRRRHHHDQHQHSSRDSSPSLDYYDAPRRRQHRKASPGPPPYRPASSHSPSPSHRSRYQETRRSPSPPGRRSTDDRGRAPRSQERRHSPSPGSAKHTSHHRRGHSSVHLDIRDDRDPHGQATPRTRRPRSHPPPIINNRHPHTGLSPRWQGAAAAAFQAGCLAAFAVRSEPGAWTGPKGARVATAALAAGTVSAAAHQSTRGEEESDSKKGTRSKVKSKGFNMVGGALSGLVAKQFAREKGSMR